VKSPATARTAPAPQLKPRLPNSVAALAEAESQISRREVGNFREYGKYFPAPAGNTNTFERRALCTYEATVTLKIEKLAGEHGTTLKLIGRIRAEHLAELKTQIAASAPSALDLREVTLVDAEVVRFLGDCESQGIHLKHCSAYIREWIVREKESAGKE
jgi:hypothetical protein